MVDHDGTSAAAAAAAAAGYAMADDGPPWSALVDHDRQPSTGVNYGGAVGGGGMHGTNPHPPILRRSYLVIYVLSAAKYES